MSILESVLFVTTTVGEGTFLQKQDKYMTMMFSVAAFCHQHGISRGLFYKLAKEGRGPKTAKIGRRTLISHESAEAWRRQIEGGGAPAR